jgi:esterase/lipase superfamily enzyme
MPPIYVITNRNLQPNEAPTRQFGENFNELGPNELRLVEANKTNGSWQVNILPDRMEYDGQDLLASEAVFLAAQKRMCEMKTNCLFFIHGFNTTFGDALEAGYRLQQLYNVEVVVFSWPSNGGGLSGVASYIDDRRDAAASINALDRCFEKLAGYLQKYRGNGCGQKVTLAMHSMAVYLFKRLLESSIYQGETLLFDNILMLSADVNNKGHAQWCDRVKYRNRMYITINEADFALRASRAKGGEQQQARLGHWINNLTSRNVVYLNFTGAQSVGDAHNYFSEAAPLQNTKVKELFQGAFQGERVEQGLLFDPGTGSYRVT